MQLIEEARRLGEADRALRNQEPLQAMDKLDRLASGAPEGKLMKERQAVRILAECMPTPSVSAQSAAQIFIQQHPSTVYRGRIQDICGLIPPARDGSGGARTSL